MKFEEIYGGASYVFEAPGVFCTWQNSYSPASHLCHFDITLFEESGDGSYLRYDERQTERMYPMRTVLKMLKESGFETVGVYGSPDGAPVTEDSERWYFVARAKKDGKEIES